MYISQVSTRDCLKAGMTHTSYIYNVYKPVWVISQVFGLYIFTDNLKSTLVNLHMCSLLGLQLLFIFCCYYEWSITSFHPIPEIVLNVGRNIVLIICVGVIQLNMFLNVEEKRFIVQSFFNLKKDIFEMKTVNFKKNLSIFYLNFLFFLIILTYLNYSVFLGNVKFYQNHQSMLIYSIISIGFLIIFLTLLQYEAFIEYVYCLFYSMTMKLTSQYSCEANIKIYFILYRICKAINKIYSIPVLMSYIFVFYITVDGISIFVGNLQDLAKGGDIEEILKIFMPRALLRLTFFFQIYSLNSRCTKLKSQSILSLHFGIKRRIVFSVCGTIELNFLLTLIVINGVATYSIVLLQFFNYSC